MRHHLPVVTDDVRTKRLAEVAVQIDVHVTSAYSDVGPHALAKKGRHLFVAPPETVARLPSTFRLHAVF